MKDLFTWKEERDAALSLKSEGQAVVLEHQEEAWRDWAKSIVRLVANTRAEFTADDVRLTAAQKGLPEPKHPNAWGAIVSAVAKHGEIIRIGYRPSNREDAHSRVVSVWRAA